jgi:hypothetical protein
MYPVTVHTFKLKQQPKNSLYHSHGKKDLYIIAYDKFGCTCTWTILNLHIVMGAVMLVIA